MGKSLSPYEKFIFLLLILSSVIFETSFSASSLDKLDTSTSSTLTPLWIPVFKDSLVKYITEIKISIKKIAIPMSTLLFILKNLFLKFFI